MSATVLVLSEDSGAQGVPVVQQLIRAGLRLLAPTHDSRKLVLRPLPENENASRAVRANAWKNKRAPERIRLLGLIATHLEQGHFVIFHVDSDRVWSKRSTSENRTKFEEMIRKGVEAVLTGAAPALPHQARKFKPLDQDTAKAHARRLIAMHPCYSIESWLYQSTSVAREKCAAIHQSEAHQTTIESWQLDRSLLDELERPKDLVLGDCVSDKHNETLAAAFPGEAVRDAGKSWSEFVDQLAACADLLSQLQ